MEFDCYILKTPEGRASRYVGLLRGYATACSINLLYLNNNK